MKVIVHPETNENFVFIPHIVPGYSLTLHREDLFTGDLDILKPYFESCKTDKGIYDVEDHQGFLIPVNSITHAKIVDSLLFTRELCDQYSYFKLLKTVLKVDLEIGVNFVTESFTKAYKLFDEKCPNCTVVNLNCFYFITESDILKFKEFIAKHKMLYNVNLKVFDQDVLYQILLILCHSSVLKINIEYFGEEAGESLKEIKSKLFSCFVTEYYQRQIEVKMRTDGSVVKLLKDHPSKKAQECGNCS